jgi:Tat protein secretion system quality control protein TatD with DNase activity
MQRTVFEMHFALAKKYAMPMYFYQRREAPHFNKETGKGRMLEGNVNTFTDFVTIIKKHRDDFTKGVVTSFSGTIEELH